MKKLYLVLTILGAVVPYVFLLRHFGTAGLDVGAFLGGAFANPVAGGLSADLLISSVVFWVWLVARRASTLWLYVVVNLTIGLSCALPLYLYRTAAR